MRSAACIVGVTVVVTASALTIAGAQGQRTAGGTFAADFPLEKGELTTTGRNTYFILEPGYQLTFEEGSTRLVITVLNETKTVAGQDTRIVEERETDKGQLVEVSRNYFAISRKTTNVYYFGEDVDMYENGQIKNHEGAWLAGVKGARFGLMMPERPQIGGRFQQEIAPGVAMDRVEVVSLSETVKTPAGSYTNCLKTLETTPLEPDAREYKFYAPGVGLIQDGSLKLVKIAKMP